MTETRRFSRTRVTELAHRLVAEVIAPGDRTIDATVGNGHDTLFLARCVGPRGRVDGFDVQEAAIISTRTKTAGLRQVFLHHLGHEAIATAIREPVAAAMFNLGYLPSGDKTLVTRPETTVVGLEAARRLLTRRGLLTIAVYPGHEGGLIEAAAVDAWIATVPEAEFEFVRHLPLSPRDPARSPYLLTLTRKNEAAGR